MYNEPRILERHTKNNWVVSLFDNGDMLVYSQYVKRVNIFHYINFSDSLRFSALPQYAQRMVYEMRDAHRAECRLSLGVRLFAHTRRIQDYTRRITR
jgi:hypothetical protein